MKKNPLTIIAEIANAHQGKVDEAIALFNSARKAKADAIKFQIYNAEELLVRKHSRYEHFKNQAFSKKDWKFIFESIDRERIEVYTDVFGLGSLKIAQENSVDGIKIHSSDLGNISLLNSILDFKGKIFISAGGSTIPELIDCLNPLFEEGDFKEIILMHGFQAYPTPVKDSNLDKLSLFKSLFENKVSYGYMDHIDGEDSLATTIPLSLISQGISYIEKHITHNRDKKGIDYYSSFEPKEFKEFISSSKKIKKAYRDSDSFFTNSEMAYRNSTKKAYVWAKDINKNSLITINDIVMKRTEETFPSLYGKEIIGKTLLKDVFFEEQISKLDFPRKILALIVVRTNSSRLPNKALKEIGGEESILHLLKRLEVSKEKSFLDKIVVCTSISNSDDELANLIEKKGYQVYRGPEENVLSRMMLALEDNPEFDIILRITGDDILIDPEYLDKTVQQFLTTNSDYTDAKNLPSGTEVEVFSRDLLFFINNHFFDTSGTEYLTNYFEAIKEHFRYSSLETEESFEKIRLTLDTEEDFEVLSNLINFFDKEGKKYTYNIRDIFSYFKKFPKQQKINLNVNQRSIPTRFNLEVDWKSITSGPLITVYITCFNYGSYVRKAIDSVLSQNFNDFELIIIDDGSTDNSREIINEYKTHPKVRIIYQENLGLNRTNNVAIQESRGQYVMRLDADDFLDPNALHMLIKRMLEDDEIALVFPDYFLVDEKNNVIGQERRHNFDEDVEVFDQPAHGACTLFKKSTLLEVGMYSEEYDCQDGFEIWTKIASSYKVSNINLPLFFYRKHGENLTGDEDRILSTRSKILSASSNESKEKNILCIVPIRSSAKVEKNLSIRQFSDSSLIDILLSKLSSSKIIKKFLVSTNDHKVMEYVMNKGHQCHLRDDAISNINSPIELTINNIIESYPELISKIKYLTVLNYEYPFMELRNIENTVDIMEIFDTNSSMSVLPTDLNLYKHEGSGLLPLSHNNQLRLERDQVYQEIGGIHSVKMSWYKRNRKLHADKVSHLIIDKNSSRKIENEDDFAALQFLYNQRHKK
ncbi:MAG: hypothetical protein CMG62_10880 [Candidatus Marinimicrobia bacterium]|nr:hypothetical protein [Candidatus Neomarinimicrobiota bacterium]